MRYILYLFTMILLFVGGMLVGNNFLPQRDASLAAAVSAPELSVDAALLQTLTREQAQQDLEKLSQLSAACAETEQDGLQVLLDRISLRLAIENFEFKKTKLELEMAKNNKANRPTSQLTQAVVQYNQARERVEKLAAEFAAATQAEALSMPPASPAAVASPAPTTTTAPSAPTAAPAPDEQTRK